MKRIVTIAAAVLLMFGLTGVALAASSSPRGKTIDPNSNVRPLGSPVYDWVATGDDPLDSVWLTMVRFDPVDWSKDNFYGTYKRNLGGSGTLEGEGYSWSANGDSILATGTFEGAASGTWQGLFVLADTCNGTWVCTNSYPPQNGNFAGHAVARPPSPYLIIYADIFDGNTELNAFAEWKRKKGFDVEMKMLGDIEGVTYDENPDVQAIREYIQGWWDPDWIVPSYVLLVGDPISVDYPEGYKAEWADPEHLPTRQYLWPLEYRMTSDYWFQIMDHDDTADVALGRWCVNNEQELSTIITKTFDYQGYSDAVPALGWEPNRTLLVAHWCNTRGEPVPDLRDSSEVIRQMFEDWDIPGYEVYTAYAQTPPSEGGPDPAAGPNNDTIKGYLEGNPQTNGIGVINYIGHAEPSYWYSWNAWGECFSNDTVYSMNQTHHGYPLVYQFCCATGSIAYGQDRALCEAWTLHPNGGAAGALGVSGSSTYGGDQYSTPMAKGIFSAHFEDNLDCGWAIIKGGIDFMQANVDFHYTSTPPDTIKRRRVFTTYWIGDPELDVWRRPVEVAYYSRTLYPSDTQAVWIYRSSDDAAVPGAKVCIYQEGGGLHVFTYTDATGKAVLPFSSEPGIYHVTATDQVGPICIKPVSFSYTIASQPSADVEESVKPSLNWQLESVSVNPANSSTKICYSVGGSGEAVPVDLSVYDASGRKVKALVSGMKNPGHYEVTWDCCDASGARCPIGVYFIRMQSGKFHTSRKETLIY